MADFKQLGQAYATGAAVSLYSPGANIQTTITSLYCCNHSGSAETLDVYIDNDGTTYTTVTAIMYQESIPANSRVELCIDGARFHMDNSSGNLAIKASTTDKITVTLSGIEHSTA